jgi:hypothetical protein
MVQGALLCPGFARKWVVGNARAMVRRSAWAHRARRRRRTCHRHIAADLRARILGGRGAQDPTPCPASRPLRSEYGINQDTLARPRLRRPAGQRVGGYGAQKLVHKSAFGRLRPYRVRRHTAGTGRRPAGPSGLHRPNGPGLPSACRASIGERAGGDEVADRVVLGDLAQLAIAEPERASPPVSRRGVAAGEQHRCQRGPYARRILGAPASRPPGQIRKMCEVPAYLRVVIEKHRTQASRTMNAEPA